MKLKTINYERIKKLGRKKLYMIAIALSITGTIRTISAHSIRTDQINQEINENYEKVYTSMYIDENNTLYDVAKKHYNPQFYHSIDTYLDEIYTVNGITKHDIIQNTNIIIPRYVTKKEIIQMDYQNTNITIPYKVKFGDTLSEIALVYGTSVEKIKYINHIKDDKIYVDQILMINTTQEYLDKLENKGNIL